MALPVLLLLPGMDGTGKLFDPFEEIARDAGFECKRVAYPPRADLGYADLVEHVRERLPLVPFVLVAESFSGPVALALSAAPPSSLVAVVTVASFATTPLGTMQRLALRTIGPLAFRMAPPRWVVRQLLVRPESPTALVESVRRVVGGVPADVLLRRISEVSGLSPLPPSKVPLLWLNAQHDKLLGAKTAPPEGALVRTVPGPHLLLQAAPSECLAVISEFVRVVGSGR